MNKLGKLACLDLSLLWVADPVSVALANVAPRMSSTSQYHLPAERK